MKHVLPLALALALALSACAVPQPDAGTDTAVNAKLEKAQQAQRDRKVGECLAMMDMEDEVEYCLGEHDPETLGRRARQDATGQGGKLGEGTGK